MREKMTKKRQESFKLKDNGGKKISENKLISGYLFGFGVLQKNKRKNNSQELNMS